MPGIQRYISGFVIAQEVNMLRPVIREMELPDSWKQWVLVHREITGKETRERAAEFMDTELAYIVP